jgi:ABC-2 type transport system ATP-binding protein
MNSPTDVSTTKNAIELRSVSKKFGDITAVNGLTLEVRKGEMFALVGPDGAGKTTTIRMLCGIIVPTEGELFVLGYDPENTQKKYGKGSVISRRSSAFMET